MTGTYYHGKGSRRQLAQPRQLPMGSNEMQSMATAAAKNKRVMRARDNDVRTSTILGLATS